MIDLVGLPLLFSYAFLGIFIWSLSRLDRKIQPMAYGFIMVLYGLLGSVTINAVLHYNDSILIWIGLVGFGVFGTLEIIEEWKSDC